MVYDVKIPDGSICEYRANILADNMYYQVYSEGFRTPSYLEPLDFQKNTTVVRKGNQYIITMSGQHRMQKSIVEWNLLISWKDDSKQWIPLSVMK